MKSNTPAGKKLIRLGIDAERIDRLSDWDFEENFSVESVYQLIRCVKNTLPEDVEDPANEAFDKVLKLYNTSVERFGELVEHPWAPSNIVKEINEVLGIPSTKKVSYSYHSNAEIRTHKDEERPPLISGEQTDADGESYSGD